MASSYTANTGIEKPATGEQSGTWGATTNTNFDIIDRALNGVGTITLSGTTHTLSTSDGALSDGGYRVLVLSGSPSGTNTITVSPNDAAKFFVVHNSSGQKAIFTQGSGANVEVNNGAKKIIYCDGAGSGATVVDVTASIELNAPILNAPILQGTSASAGKILFKEDTDNGTNSATLIGPASTADVTLTLPSTTGTVALTSQIESSFPAGTSMLFQQTAAPTGWTKQTTHNDKSLRIVTGSVGTGGSVAFSTALATPSVTGSLAAGNLAGSLSGDIGSTSLSTGQMPSHTHRSSKPQGNLTNPQVFGSPQRAAGSVSQNSNSVATSSAGSGGSHNHTTGNLAVSMSGTPTISSATATINVRYVDFIIANKD